MNASRNARFLAQFAVIVSCGSCLSYEVSRDNPRNEVAAQLQPFSVSGTQYVSLSSTFTARPPRALLFIDASCPFSMNELLRVLVQDNSFSENMAIVYVPQVLRDQGAAVETAALECARQSGAFLPYVKSRNEVISLNRRPIMESVMRAGIADTLSFQACVASVKTQALLRLYAATADRIGVSLLPVLSTGDSSWVGAQVGQRLSRNRF